MTANAGSIEFHEHLMYLSAGNGDLMMSASLTVKSRNKHKAHLTTWQGLCLTGNR
jgi:hypothetical protein